MQFATPLIFITAVWSIVESATIRQDVNYSPHLLGRLVDANAPQPAVGVLQVRDKKGNLNKSCGATLIKQNTTLGAYFITAAECFDKTSDDQEFILRYFKNSGDSFFDHPVGDYNIHHDYIQVTKEHNLAIFKTEHYFDGCNTIPELSEETVPARLPVEIFSWENNVTLDQYHSLLYSIKTETVNSNWCETLFPFSPIRGYQVCVSGSNGNGLTKKNKGAPLIQRDTEDNKRFLLVGMATLVRPSSDSIPMEFVNLVQYMTWIKDILPA